MKNEFVFAYMPSFDLSFDFRLRPEVILLDVYGESDDGATSLAVDKGKRPPKWE